MTAPYRLQIKAVEPSPAEGVAQDPAAAPDAEELVQQHEWAGDLFEGDTGEVSDPSVAFAHLKGTEGEEGWLDRAEDGTLTAWVRDTDGSVYRYTDPDAWVEDVDAAQMVRVASNLDDGQDETEPGGLDEEDSAGAGEELDPAAEGEELDGELTEDVEVDPALEEDLPDGGGAKFGQDSAEEPVEDGPTEENEDEELPSGKKKFQTKSIPVSGGAYRYVVGNFA